MNNPVPVISVYIPTRNRAGQLGDALRSVFRQSLQPAEVIVVDDASDDSTQELLLKMQKQHPTLSVIRNESPKGAAASRNLAIQRAKGEFVTGIDDDDLWKPERLKKLFALLNRENCAGVCSYDLMDDGVKKRIWKKRSVITLDDLLYYNMAGNQILTRREYILQVGGYDETLPSAQDYDLWIRLARQFGSLKSVPEALQIISIKEDEARITTSDKKIEGYRLCFEKHRPMMTPAHIRYQEYRLKMASGESPGWMEMLSAAPSHLLVKEITRKLFL